jgi:hypothetical protein
MNTDLIKGLIEKVNHSLESWIEHQISTSSSVRDLLRGRKELQDKKLVTKVLAFRHYLRIKISKHRIALTHVVLSGHALAIERMRWQEQYKTPILEK